MQSKKLLLIGLICGLLCAPSSLWSKNHLPAASHPELYLPQLKGKRVALVVNHTSLVGDSVHLVDFLLNEDIDLRRLFAPEHGLRGTEDAGATIQDGRDNKTGLPIVSLHGRLRKPQPQHLQDIDVVIYDIQDVGVRFYTYISTMHYVMEACAEQQVKMMILDRPNPQGEKIGGPVRQAGFQSFVGMHPIPVLYGLTVGELAHMVNDLGWLDRGLTCDLEVVLMPYYHHGMNYELPVAPSPNLPNSQSIELYPSLCFFEPTVVSVGRGTEMQFQVIGYPEFYIKQFSFTPESREGARNPKYKGEECFGYDLRDAESKQAIDLSYLLLFFKASNKGAAFFTNPGFFDKLAGTDELRKAMLEGKNEREIYASWEEELKTYSELRENYELYR